VLSAAVLNGNTDDVIDKPAFPTLVPIFTELRHHIHATVNHLYLKEKELIPNKKNLDKSTIAWITIMKR